MQPQPGDRNCGILSKHWKDKSLREQDRLMFDFEKLDVYQVVKDQNLKVLNILGANKKIDQYLREEWKRVSLSILLNLAEGTGRMTEADKVHYLTIARTSVFESVAIIDLLKSMNVLDEVTFQELYSGYEKSSKMLLGMYRSHVK
ncbi:MAG: four helix bundle protein [Bacteroidales bacterium]